MMSFGTVSGLFMSTATSFAHAVRAIYIFVNFDRIKIKKVPMSLVKFDVK